MSHSKATLFVNQVLSRSKRIVSGLRTPGAFQDDGEERENLVGGESLVQQSLSQPPSPQPEDMSSMGSDPEDAPPIHRYAQVALQSLSSLPFPCPLLCPEGIELTGECPVAAGGVADIWKAKHGGREVVLKTYRCYRLFDIALVAARHRNEVHVHNQLRDSDVGIVPLVGVYTTNSHPFGLIYKYMGHYDVRQYLKNEPNVDRVKLLTGIARCLNHMHDLEIVHGDFRTANILVDKDGTPHIGGLGNVRIPPHSTVRDEMGTIKVCRSCAPELARPGMSPNSDDPTHPTKPTDMYAFGVTAWEILTGRPPFSDMTEIAATYSMLNGNRPPRPNRSVISDRLWYMVERCWRGRSSERISAGEVVKLLEEESSCIPTPSV